MKLLLFILLCLYAFGSEQRIIALSPSINEIIFALGSGDKIVGNTEYCQYPKKAQSIPKVGGVFLS